jgi:hypothetical protein
MNWSHMDMEVKSCSRKNDMTSGYRSNAYAKRKKNLRDCPFAMK